MARDENNQQRDRGRDSKKITEEKKPATSGKSAPDAKSVKAEMEIRSNNNSKKTHR